MTIGSSIVVAIILALLLAWPTAIVSSLRYPDDRWRATDRDRGLWIALLVLFGAGVGLVYWLRIRPSLRRASSRG